MPREGLITDLSTFVGRTLEPSECFSRMIRLAQQSTFEDQPQADFYDVGTVTSSLTALAKLQLTSLTDCLESRYGRIDITFSDENNVPVKVTDVGPIRK